MSFETYMFDYLVAGLATQTIGWIPKESTISIILDDATTINPWQQDSSFAIVITYKNKVEADTLSQAVKAVLYNLRTEAFINSVSIDTEHAERPESPGAWVYSVDVRVRHRVREW